MNLRFTHLCFIFFLITIFSCVNSNIKNNLKFAYPEDLTQLHQNVLAYYTNQNLEDSAIEILLANLTDEGAWSTIDYTNKRRSEWPVKDHLEYLQTLAISYNNTTSRFYKDISLSKKIHQGLDYWLAHDFLSTNWHDQHIGVPKLLLPILLLMETELSQQQLDKAMVLAHRAKIKMSGQNKVWLATNVMLRSLLLRKSDSVAIASKAIQQELRVSKSVGLKADGSYHEHGAQLQFGNYGLWYLENMIQCYALVHNTPFQFASKKIAIIRNYILEGQQWILWNNSYDVNALGRHLFKDEQLKKSERLKVCITKMKALDVAHANAYNTALTTTSLSGNKHFWKSDFHVHRRKDFYFSVKMSSKRVVGTESVNSENIQGYYMGDGVALLSVNHKAYQNVFPFWDWKKLPGTTIVQDTTKLPIIKFRDFKTNSEFVGGVSNTQNGIAVMDYNRNAIKVKKAWFMFDDTIVCLGAGIASPKKDPVTTAINQTFLQGNVTIGNGDSIQTKIKKGSHLKTDWILHDSIGYFFPNGGDINFSTRLLVGSWNKVAKLYHPVLLTDHIFKLWFAHGTQPKDKTYSYVLVPNATETKMKALTKKNPFKIVNTNAQQSVETLNGKKAGVVFYTKGTSNIKGGIMVDEPCVVILEEKPNHLELALSDPTHTLKEIKVTLQGKYAITNSNYSGGKTQFKIALPQRQKAGKTVVLALKRLE